MKGKVLEAIRAARASKRSLLYILIDPDNAGPSVEEFLRSADASGVDGYLVGGSLTFGAEIGGLIHRMKTVTSRPLVIFPGGVHHIHGAADALLFLSLISGRNADHLIGQHVVAAPLIRKLGLEAIATGYLLIESGAVSTAEFMSFSRPLPRTKPEIAAAHALAAEYLGMHIVYLEAGSGAPLSVPEEMIALTARTVSIPVMAGGGIRTPADAAAKARAGATVVVVGNHFESEANHPQLREFAEAVHTGSAPGAAV